MNPTKYLFIWALGPLFTPIYRRIYTLIYETSLFGKYCKIFTSDNFRNSGPCWSYICSNSNKLIHSLTGNKKNGYHVAVWNCRRGLIDRDGNLTSKLSDIQL